MKTTFFSILMMLSACFLGSCNNNSKEKVDAHKAKTEVKVMANKTIHVYFFEGFNKSLGENTLNELKETFDSVAFEGTIPFPDSAYYSPRQRYKADKLVKHLRQLQASNSELVVGFSPKDISDKAHGYDDFGVMGWTRHSLRSSVVSTHRLADKSRLQEDFVKLVLHELGHADGLPHCKESTTCYMRDANKQNHFPELFGFCDKCTKHLKSKGWKLL